MKKLKNKNIKYHENEGGIKDRRGGNKTRRFPFSSRSRGRQRAGTSQTLPSHSSGVATAARIDEEETQRNHRQHDPDEVGDLEENKITNKNQYSNGILLQSHQ
jgi:hypothetical protein